MPSSLYFTYHNPSSKEHALINPLHTDLRVAETISRLNWHTSYLNELYISLSAFSLKSSCNGSLSYSSASGGRRQCSLSLHGLVVSCQSLVRPFASMIPNHPILSQPQNRVVRMTRHSHWRHIPGNGWSFI